MELMEVHIQFAFAKEQKGLLELRFQCNWRPVWAWVHCCLAVAPGNAWVLVMKGLRGVAR